MAIHKAYEKDGEPLITPANFYEKSPFISDVVVVCFSYKARDYVLASRPYEVYRIFPATANGPATMYYLKEDKVLLFMSPIGAAVAGAMLEEVAYMFGAHRFVYFGSCGVLDPSLKGKYLVPSACYREEGYSFHYAPPSDYLRISNHGTVASFLERQGVDFVTGKGWTTDAMYHETKAKISARRKEGVLCVGMEASGLEAIANHIGVDLYVFFFAGDLLSAAWEAGDLGGERERRRQTKAVDLAIELGKSLLC
ncbi:MAG: hypothetical protein E7182_05625 [Erysipelotrichaceae bacterium]|nr:hypothetical protein [Erysipelotrichaceae bacterium]